jgi:hypothetical protein
MKKHTVKISHDHLNGDLNGFFCRQLAVSILVGVEEVRKHFLLAIPSRYPKLEYRGILESLQLISDEKDTSDSLSLPIGYIIRIFLVLYRGLCGEITPHGDFLKNLRKNFWKFEFCPACELESFPDKLQLVLNRKSYAQKMMSLIEMSFLSSGITAVDG